MFPDSALLKIALICAATAGFAAGKLDIDEKIKTAIARQNQKMAQLNARTFVDELENRKLGIPVKGDS
jgi:hypothetical protein